MHDNNKKQKRSESRVSFSANNKRSDFGVEFVTIYLQQGDKEAIKSLNLTFEDQVVELYRFVEQGYKFSLTLDARHDSYIASLTGKTTGTSNDNRCLSSRGSTPENAVLSLYYKHVIVCKGNEWPAYPVDSSFDDFG